MHRAWSKYLLLMVVLILSGSLVYILFAFSVATQYSPAHKYWFDDVDTAIPLSNDEADYTMREIIRGIRQNEVDASELFVQLSSGTSPQVVFISSSNTRTKARVVIGTGSDLVAALQDAIARMRNLGLKDSDLKWLKLDIMKPAAANQAIPAHSAAVDLSLEGIAFPRQTAQAILPTQLVAWRALDNEGNLLLENIPSSMQTRLAPLWRLATARFSESMREHLNEVISPQGFTTESFFFNGKETFRLSRGARIPKRSITPGELLKTARLAGDYLQRSIFSDGSFAYCYLPGPDEFTEDYNLVRHAGTVYAMLELYEVENNAELLKSSQRAIEYLLKNIREYGSDNSEMSVLVSGKTIKLGGVALTIVALAKYSEVTQDLKYLPLMVRLAHYIRDSQRVDGSFISQRYYPRGNIRKDFISQYYPGEAILALLRLHALKPEQIWIDTAAKAAHYLITERDHDTDTTDLIHDHWLLYALNDLYRYQPKFLYLTHAMRISHAITLAQNQGLEHADFAGSYYLPPRSTPTATRTEGLVAAYRMARDAGRLLDARQIRGAIDLGITFQLRTQVLPEKAMYFKDPQRALGGFHKGLDDYEIRIDYVQHNLSAILGQYHRLRSEVAK